MDYPMSEAEFDRHMGDDEPECEEQYDEDPDPDAGYDEERCDAMFDRRYQ